MSQENYGSIIAWRTLLNTTNQPYFYGHGTIGGQTPNDGNGGLFISPDSFDIIQYGRWYTMFIVPRGTDGNDITASYGYSQVINFRFTRPSTNTRLMQSDNLPN